MDLRQDLKLSNKRNIEIHIENMCKLSILSQFFEFFLTVILSNIVRWPLRISCMIDVLLEEILSQHL